MPGEKSASDQPIKCERSPRWYSALDDEPCDGPSARRAGRRIFVRRTVWRGQLLVPKSKRSRRAINVGDHLLGVLAAWRRVCYGDTPPPPTAFIFASSIGGPADSHNFRARIWKPTLKRAALAPRRIHAMRHFFASMLIAQRENLKYISSQLGHASIGVTVDVYGHLLSDDPHAAVTRFEARLASSKNPAEQVGLAETGRDSVDAKPAPALTGEN